jgi:hypothetical protein
MAGLEDTCTGSRSINALCSIDYQGLLENTLDFRSYAARSYILQIPVIFDRMTWQAVYVADVENLGGRVSRRTWRTEVSRRICVDGVQALCQRDLFSGMSFRRRATRGGSVLVLVV